MRKPDKREHINLFFSAFLILAFIICANFFSNFTSTMDNTMAQLIYVAVYAVFGLLLFYATRVGDGKAVKRFSPLTLIVLVLPALLIIVASIASFMPLHDVLAADKLTGKLSIITTLAAVALGYGIPYSFFSGFELAPDKTAEAAEPETEVLEGGVEADVLAAQEKADSEETEAETEEALLQNADAEADSDAEA